MEIGAPWTAMKKLLQPRSLAFVGVSPRGGAGAKMMQSAARFGFDGPIWPVNARYEEIAGLRCYPSLSALPHRPDCVVVAVPAEAALDVLSEAQSIGVQAALVVSEGFADAGDDAGRARQEALVALACRSNMAVAGPNCMGVASFAQGWAATMADIPARAQSGGISLVSQSGGLLNAVAELAANRGVGMNYLVSIGNQAVVDLADYIDFLAQDAATRVIALIIEGAKHGARFRTAVERASRLKPVVVLKLGRSETGQAATLAHTGTLAGSAEAYQAIFRRNGVASVDSIDELVETASLLERAPPPRGEGVVMLTVSGGATSLIADLGEKAGVRFPPLGEATNRRLCEILDVERRFGNPVDTVGMPRLRRGDNMRRVLDALAADPAVAVIGLVLGMRMDGIETHSALIAELAAAQSEIAKPLLVISFMSNSLTGHWRGYAAKHGLPLVEDLERGLAAVSHLVAYAAHRRRLQAASDVPEQIVPPAETLAVVEARLPQTRGVLTEADSKLILAAAGLPVTREILVATPDEAVSAAQTIGAPVALKIQSPDIPHKSNVGGVRLGAHGAEAVREGAQAVLDNSRRACPDAQIQGVLVQEMAPRGVEMILGMTWDDQFGPMILLGAGGVLVEIFKDAAVRPLPLTPADVRAMLSEIKAARLLEGFRGAEPADVGALVDCCLRFAAFVEATAGHFAAIDLNPVFVCGKGQGVRIADALIVLRDPQEREGHDGI